MPGEDADDGVDAAIPWEEVLIDASVTGEEVLIDASITEQEVLFDASKPCEEDSIDESKPEEEGGQLEEGLTVRSKGSSHSIFLICRHSNQLQRCLLQYDPVSPNTIHNMSLFGFFDNTQLDPIVSLRYSDMNLTNVIRSSKKKEI